MKSVFIVLLLSFAPTLYGQMVLNGTATGTCDCYTITTGLNQAGSIWSPSTIDLTNTFDFTFSINMGASDGGADGMVFVLRQSGTFTGTGGGMLGYVGIPNSIGIEVDTWNNGFGGDIASDHLGMSANGVLDHALQPAFAIANIEDGVYHDFRVTWDPATLEMEVFLDDISRFIYTGDIVASFFGGNPDVYFGWTGATGGASNVQSVCIDLEADFVADDVVTCPGQEITFTNTTENPLIYNGVADVAWDWTFGGGDISDLENPVYTYETIGSKTVTLTVTNLIGCTDVTALSITVDSIDIEVSATDITCFGYDDGTATAVGITGDAPYAFLWDDPIAQTTPTAIDLEPGTYTVLVTDAVGCEQWRSIEIFEPTELVMDGAIIVNATCGLDDGTLDLTASGGTLDYEYSVDGGGTFFPSPAFIDLPDGPLMVEIRDANGCTYPEEVIIGSNDLIVEMTHTNISCFGFDDGTATASPEFGVAPCSYLWDDPLVQVTPTAVGLAPGTYTVIVSHDDIGCSGTNTVTITQPDELLISGIVSVNASCGVDNGQITITASGGTLPYEYSINGGADFLPGPTFTGLTPGSYDLIVRDANGCTVEDNVVLINVSNVPDIVIVPDSPDGCKALTVHFNNYSDPTLTAHTHWDFGDGSTAEGAVVSHTYENAGCYDVHIVITTFDGCTTEATLIDFICVWELPIAEFNFSPTNPTTLKSEVDFENLSEHAVNYEWEFGDGDVSTDFEPSHSYPVDVFKLYPVRLIAITDKGCRDTAYQYIQVDEIVQYYIPNTFTPDSDPFNQHFGPVFMTGFDPLDYHFLIFNKWGEILWESYNPTVSWDGTYGNSMVEDGVYIWQLTFRENQTDRKIEDFGHVTILK